MTSRWRDDRGLGGAEVLPLALLAVLGTTLLLASLWSALDVRLAAQAAAREAARAAAEAGSADAGRRAEEVARAVLAGHGRGAGASVQLQGRHRRCATVGVEVTVPVPVVVVPWLGGVGGTEVRAAHRAVVDPYRDGLDGAADCGP